MVRWWSPSEEIPEILIISNLTYIKPKQIKYNSFAINTDVYSRVGLIAKFGNYSTGIVWDECHDTIFNVKKMKHSLDYLPKPYFNSIEIDFQNIQCCHKAAVDSVTIEYWKEGEIIQAKTNVSTNLIHASYILRNLNPYTTYNLNLSMHSSIIDFEKGQEIKKVTTLEKADSPTDINARNITSDSIILSWKPSVHANSTNITKYNVYRKGSSSIIVRNRTDFKVKCLDSNTTYEFWITATYNHTKQSGVSGILLVKTAESSSEYFF